MFKAWSLFLLYLVLVVIEVKCDSSTTDNYNPLVECGRNQVRVTKGCVTLPACEKCIPEPCPRLCKQPPGCKCAPGFCRDKDNHCVPIKKAPVKCGKHEVLVSSCPKPRGCEKCSAIGNACTAACQKGPGCNCAKGYCRNDKGDCVRIKKKKCPKHEVLVIKGCLLAPECEKCSKARCPKICMPLPGCKCKKGYCRDHNGKCVRKKTKPKCGKCEVYTPDCVIPPMCQKCNSDIACKIACPTKPGCNCAAHCCRDEHNKCVPKKKEEPPITCGKNEIYTPDCVIPTVCQRCNSGIACKIPCPTKPGCNCAPGFCRNEDNKCVPGKVIN